jgi:hypothetical protein
MRREKIAAARDALGQPLFPGEIESSALRELLGMRRRAPLGGPDHCSRSVNLTSMRSPADSGSSSASLAMRIASAASVVMVSTCLTHLLPL